MNNDLDEVDILLVEDFPSAAELCIRSRCVTYPSKVDGKEILRRVKSDERTRYIPVVVPTLSRAVQGLGFYWLPINRTPI
jgi:hypothetical protein